MQTSDIIYQISPPAGNAELNALFAAAWPDHAGRDFQAILARSLAYVCASAAGELIGFVNLAWDGGIHAFLLDTTVHPDWRRRGIGGELVRRAVEAARGRGMEWVHVDYEDELEGFYRGCGFAPTLAGLVRLQPQVVAGRAAGFPNS